MCSRDGCENSLEGMVKRAKYCSRYCKEKACAKRQYQPRARQKNPPHTKAKARNRAYIEEQKAKPCTDCGVSYPHYVMDFDHLPEFEKKFEIGRGSKYALETLKAEIAKCDLVCSNCHRMRTWKRMEENSNVELTLD